jgi:catechol 2,3-dioxygenase-like lactoylglutathione lyase family enzyme
MAGTPSTRRKRGAAALDHVVLETADPVASVRFYERVLAFPPVRLDEFVAGKVLFPSVRVNASSVIDMFPPKMWAGPEPRNPNHFCIALDAAGVRAVKRRLARQGIPITREDKHNFGARGFARSIYFSDPDGISVEVRLYASAVRNA